MRIAYICADPGVPVFGCKGCSIHVQEMARAMLGRNATVDLFAARIGGSPPNDLNGCRVHELPVDKSETPRDRELGQVLWNRRIAQALDGRSFDLVYERYSIWNAGAMLWASRNGIPSILEVNAPLIDEQAEHRELIQRRLAENLTERAMQSAKVTYSVSSEIVSYCQRFLPGNRRVAVIPNGVNTNRFSPSVAPSSPSHAFTIGFVGSLKPWHGIEELLAAFEALQAKSDEPSSRLLIVGDGPRRSDIDLYLEQRPHLQSCVQVTGAVKPNEIPALLTSMDVAVAPYPNIPNFYFSPLKIFEYMAAGRPIVASSSGQVPEVVHNGENGLLYEPGNAQQLAKRLQRLREDGAMRRRIGANARRDALDRDWSHVLDQVLKLAGLSLGSNGSCGHRGSDIVHEETVA